MDYTIGQKFIFIYLLTYLLDLRPEKTKICLGTLWFEKKFISGGCLSCLASLECGEHRVITQSLVVSPKWKLFTMVGPVRLRIRDRILGRGVVKIHICVDIIFKWTGGSVHCLKYSQIVIIIKKMYSIHKYEFLPTPLPFAYRCTCPTVVKSFAKRKDE